MNNDQIKSLHKNHKGLSTMEYAVLFVVIVVGALVAWGQLGEDLNTKIENGKTIFKTTTDEAQGRAGIE